MTGPCRLPRSVTYLHICLHIYLLTYLLG